MIDDTDDISTPPSNSLLPHNATPYITNPLHSNPLLTGSPNYAMPVPAVPNVSSVQFMPLAKAVKPGNQKTAKR